MPLPRNLFFKTWTSGPCLGFSFALQNDPEGPKLNDGIDQANGSVGSPQACSR